MYSIVPSDKGEPHVVFDGVLTKSMHCIVPCERSGVVGVRQGQTYSMHCIVPSESGEVNLVFDMAHTKYKHCIVPSREIEGVRQGSD